MTKMSAESPDRRHAMSKTCGHNKKELFHLKRWICHVIYFWMLLLFPSLSALDGSSLIHSLSQSPSLHLSLFSQPFFCRLKALTALLKRMSLWNHQWEAKIRLEFAGFDIDPIWKGILLICDCDHSLTSQRTKWKRHKEQLLVERWQLVERQLHVFHKIAFIDPITVINLHVILWICILLLPCLSEDGRTFLAVL